MRIVMTIAELMLSIAQTDNCGQFYYTNELPEKLVNFEQNNREIERKMMLLEAKNEELQKENEELQKGNQELWRFVKDLTNATNENKIELKEQNNRLDKTVIALQVSMADIEKKNEQLQVNQWYELTMNRIQNRYLNTTVQQMETEIDFCRSKIKDLNVSVLAQQESIATLEGRALAFTTRLGSSQNISTTNEAVKFDIVLYNGASMYDQTTGKVTVPESGTYVFFYTCMAKPDSITRLRFVIGKKRYDQCWVDSRGLTKAAQMSSRMITMFLRKSTTVYIGQDNGDHPHIHVYHTTFSGFKM